jgi:hypothetical protein
MKTVHHQTKISIVIIKVVANFLWLCFFTISGGLYVWMNYGVWKKDPYWFDRDLIPYGFTPIKFSMILVGIIMVQLVLYILIFREKFRIHIPDDIEMDRSS